MSSERSVKMGDHVFSTAYRRDHHHIWGGIHTQASIYHGQIHLVAEKAWKKM